MARGADARALTPGAAALARLLAAGGHPLGLETSVRWRPGRVEARRVLLSQVCAALPPIGTLAAALEGLGLPRAAWLDAAPGAAFLHLGHEADAPETFKLYLEAELGAPPAAGACVHRAWKWRVGAAPRREAYHFLPPGAVAARLGALAAAGDAAGRIAAALAAWLPPGETPFGLAVTDADGGPRAGLDLRLYGLGLPIRALAPVLEVAAAALALPGGAAAALLAERGAARLGHVALGLDAAGAPFLTVYGGAMEVAPRALGLPEAA